MLLADISLHIAQPRFSFPTGKSFGRCVQTAFQIARLSLKSRKFHRHLHRQASHSGAEEGTCSNLTSFLFFRADADEDEASLRQHMEARGAVGEIYSGGVIRSQAGFLRAIVPVTAGWKVLPGWTPTGLNRNFTAEDILKRLRCQTFLLLASVVAAVSGFMLGYEMGLISGALLQLRELLSLTCQRQEMAVSSLLFGALLISLVGGFILDRYGRKSSIIASACTVVVGTLVVIGFASYPALIAGRAVVGMAVALSGTASCLYIAEIAPKDKRGLLVCLYELMVVIGILLGFGFSYAFADVPGGWKYMFAVVVPPAILQGVTMLFLPVSPRFLMKNGKHQAAQRVLVRLGASSADEELQSIQSSVKEESQYSFLDLFRSKDNIRMRLMIGVALVFFQQVTGQPNVLFYASTILKSVGFHSNQAATLASTGLGVVKVVATVPAVLLVDRLGSKAFLCVGSVVMTLSLATLGVVTLQSHANVTSLCRSPVAGGLNHTAWPQNASEARAPGDFRAAGDFRAPVELAPPVPDGLNLTNASDGWMTKGRWSQEGGKVTEASPLQTGASGALKWLSLVSLLVYVTAFSISLGPMVYVVLSEIFPLGIRGKAVSVVSAINWGTNLVISLTFLTVTDKIGLPNVIFTYAAMSFALLVFVILYIPETKGRSLEQISKELAKKGNAGTNCVALRSYRPVSTGTVQIRSEAMRLIHAPQHVLEGRSVCRFNSSPRGPTVSAGLTPVLEGRSVCRFNSSPGGPQCLQVYFVASLLMCCSIATMAEICLCQLCSRSSGAAPDSTALQSEKKTTIPMMPARLGRGTAGLRSWRSVRTNNHDRLRALEAGGQTQAAQGPLMTQSWDAFLGGDRALAARRVGDVSVSPLSPAHSGNRGAVDVNGEASLHITPTRDPWRNHTVVTLHY
ncbi:hypothetical protein SKAU_G00185490 [Synaphobranchus kaupii]|uniref:Solute carrier family 2, facilitated glucose transporter member 12 n=1 Tax=Synaphobranchus kaupii TaxID=118154 RepID=A0A9Q1FCF6_SYNKA|nr:hypothetical protein SKAU_G00185490 [Synaphobranchus kaupii]